MATLAHAIQNFKETHLIPCSGCSRPMMRPVNVRGDVTGKCRRCRQRETIEEQFESYRQERIDDLATGDQGGRSWLDMD